MAFTIIFEAMGFLTVAPSPNTLLLDELRSPLLPIEAVDTFTVRLTLPSSPKALTVVFAAPAPSTTALMSHSLGLDFLCF